MAAGGATAAAEHSYSSRFRSKISGDREGRRAVAGLCCGVSIWGAPIARPREHASWAGPGKVPLVFF
jgi:hypothetical protein